MKGYVHVYTGTDKEVHPEIGLCLRAAGAGLNALVIQFFKKGDEDDIKALAPFADQVAFEQFCSPTALRAGLSEEDIAEGRQGMDRLRKAVYSGKHDLVVVQNGNTAAGRGLFSAKELLEIIENRPVSVELAVTGPNADPQILAAADLVTEMMTVKHSANTANANQTKWTSML